MEPQQYNPLETPQNPNPVYPDQPVAPPPGVEPPREKKQLNLPLILAVLMFLLALGLGILAIIYIQKYADASTNLDQHRAEAASAAKEEQKQADEKDFLEREKLPYRAYEAPAVLGALKIEFPKTWNVYALEEETASLQLDIYMYPGVVRATQSTTEPYSFRAKLERKLYTDALESYSNDVEKGTLKAKAVTVSGITGTRLDGEVVKGRTGSLILLPVRDKTLSIWTESPNYAADFETIVQKINISP